MGSKSSPPPAPDYKGAAEATASSQRVNQVTPYGSLQYSQGPSTQQQTGSIWGQPIFESKPGDWTSTISLDPRAQQTLDTQMGLSNDIGDVTRGQIPHVQDTYSRPMDSSSVQDVSDKAYGALTSRLDPQWTQNEQMQKTQLANQGLAPGGEAYDNSMRVFNQGKNDAYQQANLGAIQTMPQTYQLESSIYNQPLNTLNALRTGAQVQNPQFNYNQPGTNYLGAAQGQGQYGMNAYNQQVAQQNAMQQGLFGLGGAGMMAYALA